MRSLKYSIPLALAIWWLPILGPIIVGLANSFLERKLYSSIISSIISSAIASTVYIFLAVKFLFVPLLGDLLQFLSIILSIVGIGISAFVAFLVSRHMVYSYYNENSLNMEFYAKDQDEIEDRLRPFYENCSSPVYSFSENKIIVKRKCSGFTLEYEMTKEGKGYRVKVRVIQGDA
ncbi:hypothetical protein [Acidianus brierleyi]|uniref:Uncharacterized protein n=1 Tax=Acidianus brierleyi TaxID=41673 RepID=A0A2U9IBE6_9CREN|nr:hypothetical protein [Acidianus brierleyi]AWR93323.1 hypothetical protein DFR85_00575 [Acidianus brierleyi]